MDAIDQLLYSLNSYAMDLDESAFGLPLYSIGDADHMGALRTAVITFRDEAVMAERARCLALVRKICVRHEDCEE